MDHGRRAEREAQLHLTNITHALLPEGAVASCSLVVEHVTPPLRAPSDRAAYSRPGTDLPVSFDQRMHVGAGPRPGTWMAVAFELSEPVTRQVLGAAWLRVIQRHHTLRTVFERRAHQSGSDPLRLYEVAEPLSVVWKEHSTEQHGTRATLNRVLDQGCSPMARPAHRLCVVTPANAEEPVTVVLAADHSHLDAWSLPLLAHDFLQAVKDVSLPAPPPPVASAAAFVEHTRALATREPAPEMVQQRWQQILADGHGTMPIFPLPLGQLEPAPPETVSTRAVLDVAELAVLESRAEQMGHRLFTLVVCAMTRATLTTSGAPLRAVLPVHSRTEPKWQDAVGWFITNSVLDSPDPDPSACRAAVREALKLGSHALEPIMRPYGGMPVPLGMFMISYLDYRRLPAALPGELNPQHISASAPTTGVQVWFVVNHSGLQLRARYPQTAVAAESVDRWLSAVMDGLRSMAATRSSPTGAATLNMN